MDPKGKYVKLVRDYLEKIPEIIEGSNIFLKKLALRDARYFYHEIDDPNVLRFLHVSDPQNLSDIKQLIKYFRKSWRKKTGFTYSIFIKARKFSELYLNNCKIIENNAFCGSVNLTNIDFAKGTGEVGIWLGSKFWHKGINYEALKLLIKFGFDFLSLSKIIALILPGNQRSIKTFENLNFKLEGKKDFDPKLRKNKNTLLVYSISKKVFEDYV